MKKSVHVVTNTAQNKETMPRSLTTWPFKYNYSKETFYKFYLGLLTENMTLNGMNF